MSAPPDPPAPSPPPPPPAAPPTIGPGALFVVFAKIGVMSIGGALPVIYRELVDHRRWLTQREFTEILAICHVMPGPNIVNVSVVFGMRQAGWGGAVAAVTGLLALPIAFAFGVGLVYAELAAVGFVRDSLATIGSAAAGLVAAVAIKLFWPERRNSVVLGIAGLCIVALVAVGLALPLVILALGPLGVAFTAYARRGNE